MTDIASVRFSLPAQLLEPTPNLGITKMSSGLRSSENIMLMLLIRVLELSRSARNIHKARNKTYEMSGLTDVYVQYWRLGR